MRSFWGSGVVRFGVPVLASALVYFVEDGIHTLGLSTVVAVIACIAASPGSALLAACWSLAYVSLLPYGAVYLQSRFAFHLGLSLALAPEVTRAFSHPEQKLAGTLLRCTGLVIGLVMILLRAFPLGVGLVWATYFAVHLYPCRKPWRRWAGAIPNILLVVASSALTVVAVDLFTRFALGWHDSSGDVYALHRTAFFTHNPGGHGDYIVKQRDAPSLVVPLSISSQGLREDRLYGPKAPDEIRVLLLGDSFTEGYGVLVDEMISRRIEARIGDSIPGKRVVVINGGVAGYAPWQSRMFLEEVCLAFEPDIVLHQIFPTNDIDGMLDREDIALEAFDVSRVWDVWNSKQWQLPLMRFDRVVQRYSALYAQWLRYTGGKKRINYYLRRTRFFPQRPLPRTSGRSSRVPYIEPLLVEQYPELAEAWRLLLASVGDCREICQSRGIAYGVYVVPNTSQIYEPMWDEYTAKALDGEEYDRWRDRAIISSYCADASIPYIDVSGALLTGGEPLSLYYEYDGHFQPKGADVVAAVLADWLVRVWGLK